jgi:hypothetical protein
MGWEKFSTTPVGFGVPGGGATLPALTGRSQLVRVETQAPQVWCVRLQSTGYAQFAFTIGNGQTSQSLSYTVNGSQFVNVIASTLEVDAINTGASAVVVSASAAPANGPDRSPDVVTNTTKTLVAGVAQTIIASGRAYALVHNNTGAAMSVRVNSLDIAQVANTATYRVDYAGAFQIYSGTGGNVNVAEFWR